MILGEKFFKLKQNVNSLKEAVETHFRRVIKDIENGLPAVKDEECKEDEYEILLRSDWTCPTCQNLMKAATEACTICRTKRILPKKKNK